MCREPRTPVVKLVWEAFQHHPPYDPPSLFTLTQAQAPWPRTKLSAEGTQGAHAHVAAGHEPAVVAYCIRRWADWITAQMNDLMNLLSPSPDKSWHMRICDWVSTQIWLSRDIHVLIWLSHYAAAAMLRNCAPMFLNPFQANRASGKVIIPAKSPDCDCLFWSNMSNINHH